jgi:hypothetical protein
MTKHYFAIARAPWGRALKGLLLGLFHQTGIIFSKTYPLCHIEMTVELFLEPTLLKILDLY